MCQAPVGSCWTPPAWAGFAIGPLAIRAVTATVEVSARVATTATGEAVGVVQAAGRHTGAGRSRPAGTRPPGRVALFPAGIAVMKRVAILAIDVGTTACKALLVGLDGGAVGFGQAEYPTYHPRPLQAEQDAEDWWAAAVAAVRAALKQAAPGGPLEVAAIGLSSQRETVVLTDGAGRPLARALSWMDRRGSEEIRRFADRVGREALHRTTGMVPDATFTLSKLLWLKRHEPHLLARARWLLQPRDFVAYRLTGRIVTDPSLASRTMMWDTEAGTWWQPAFDEVGIATDRFPAVVASHAVVGPLSAEAASALGLPAGVPVVAGGGDRCCEALGAGIGPGEAMESTGTTSNLSAVSPSLPHRRDSRLAYTAHVLPGRWLVEQGLNATGAILRWLRALAYAGPAEAGPAGDDLYERMSAEAAAVPPGAEGLFLLPFFMGARSPRWQPLARGAAVGLTLEHGRAHLVRAAMEGVAFELRACRQVLEEAGLAPVRIVAMGGGAKSSLWLQIKAAVMGVPFVVPRNDLAAPLGAAVLAGWGVGLFEDPEETARRLNPPRLTARPDAGLASEYRGVVERYERLVQGMLALYPELYPQPQPPAGGAGVHPSAPAGAGPRDAPGPSDPPVPGGAPGPSK